MKTLVMPLDYPDVPESPVVVVILSVPRTGSNLFVDLLRSIPQVDVRGEILDPAHTPGRPADATGESALAYLRELLAELATDLELRRTTVPRPGCIGFKAHLDQLKTSEITADDLRDALPGARFVLIHRRDLFAQYVSAQRAMITGEWTSTQIAASTPDPVQLQIDADAFRRYRATIREWFEEIVARPWYDSVLSVAYEDLAAAKQKTFDELVLPFLGLPPSPVVTTMRKQILQPPWALVENYESITAIVAEPETILELPSGWHPSRA